jgi:hypothetical protein
MLKVEQSSTSLGLPVIWADVDLGCTFRFESQPDGFGLMWPTHLRAEDAIRAALSVLPSPELDDLAKVHRRATYKEILGADIEEEIEDNPSEISLVRIDIGAAALVWAKSFGDGLAATTKVTFSGDGIVVPEDGIRVEVQSDKPGLHVMSHGDDWYRRERIAELLFKTAPEYFVPDLSPLLDRADLIMQDHLPPT